MAEHDERLFDPATEEGCPSPKVRMPNPTQLSNLLNSALATEGVSDPMRAAFVEPFVAQLSDQLVCGNTLARALLLAAYQAHLKHEADDTTLQLSGTLDDLVCKLADANDEVHQEAHLRLMLTGNGLFSGGAIMIVSLQPMSPRHRLRRSLFDLLSDFFDL